MRTAALRGVRAGGAAGVSRPANRRRCHNERCTERTIFFMVMFSRVVTLFRQSRWSCPSSMLACFMRTVIKPETLIFGIRHFVCRSP